MGYYTPGTPATANTLARAENIATELTTIKAAFDKIPEQLSLEQDRAAYALDTGVANAYLVAMPNTWTAYTTGASLRMKAVNANTGASTINVDGLGVKTVTRFNGDALLEGDIPAASVLEYYYDGTNFQLAGGPATITNAVIGPASSTDNAVMRFNGTSGKAAQNSGITIDDSDVLAGITQLNVDNLRLDGNTLSAQSGKLLLEGVAASEIVLNEAGVDVDTRIEGLNTPNLLTLDAAQDAVSLGGANVDGAAFALNNLQQRTHITSVGSQLHVPAQTTDFDNPSSTIAIGSAAFLGIPTWTNANATLTMTEAATLYIEGAPVGSTNVTVSAGYSLFVDGGNARFDGNMSVGSTLTAGDGTLHVHTATAGAVTANLTVDDLVLENSTSGGLSILVPDASISALIFGSPAGNVGARIDFQQSTALMRIGTNLAGGQLAFVVASTTEAGRFDANGSLFIGDTVNANMTVGLTINQGANDDQIFALKSSDVGTGLTSVPLTAVETDDFFTISKRNADQGGVLMQSLSEDGASSVVLQIASFGGTADTAKTTGARGLVEISVAEHDGSNALADITADGNVFVVRRRVSGSEISAFVVDEDGDLLADGGVASTDMVTLFDGEEDVALCRAFDLLRAEKGGAESQLIRTEWDDWASEHRGRLVELGVLGEDGEDGARGLVNVTQLQRLHNGAICQLHTALMATQNRLALAESKLAALPN